MTSTGFFSAAGNTSSKDRIEMQRGLPHCGGISKKSSKAV